MELRLKVIKQGYLRCYSLPEALEERIVSITPQGLVSQKGVNISRSSELVDRNGKEIYEGDILEDDKNNRFSVRYNNGNFVLDSLNNSNNKDSIFLSALKMAGHLDVFQIIN